MKRIKKGENQQKEKKKKKDKYVGESKMSDRGSLNMCVFTKISS